MSARFSLLLHFKGLMELNWISLGIFALVLLKFLSLLKTLFFNLSPE